MLFRSIITNFSHPVHLTPPLMRGFPWTFVTGQRRWSSKKLQWCPYQMVVKVRR